MNDIPDSGMSKPKKKAAKTTPKTEKQLLGDDARIITAFAERCAEHFSNVQIIATKVMPDGQTLDFAAGSGDIHARYHASKVWVQRVAQMFGER